MHSYCLVLNKKSDYSLDTTVKLITENYFPDLFH